MQSVDHLLGQTLPHTEVGGVFVRCVHCNLVQSYSDVIRPFEGKRVPRRFRFPLLGTSMIESYIEPFFSTNPTPAHQDPVLDGRDV